MPGGEKHRPVIRSAPGAVGRYLSQPDNPEMVTLGIENPDSLGAGAVNPAFHIDLHSIRDAIFCRMHVCEQPAAGRGAIGSDVVGIDKLMGADLTPLFFLLAVIVFSRVGYI